METITDEVLLTGLKQRAQMLEDELNITNDSTARRILMQQSAAILNVAKMFGAKDEEWTIRHSFIYNNMKKALDKIK